MELSKIIQIKIGIIIVVFLIAFIVICINVPKGKRLRKVVWLVAIEILFNMVASNLINDAIDILLNNIETKEQSTDYNNEREEMLYTDNTVYDFSKCVNLESFHVMYSDDNSFSFGYPKYLFNQDESVPSDNYYEISYSGENLSLKVYEAETTGSGYETVKNLGRKCASDIIGDDLHLSEEGDKSGLYRGYYRARCAGQTYEGYGIYFIAVSNGEHTYVMEYKYPVYFEGETLNDVNYVVDCIYQYLSFSGSTHNPRTYEKYIRNEW